MKFYLLPTLMIFYALRVSAQSCSTVEKIELPGGVVRDQANTGWCYAYVAADLLGHKIGFKVSGIDIAIGESATPEAQKLRDQGKSEADFAYGFSALAMQRALNEGVCRESRFRSDLATDSSDDYIDGVVRSVETSIKRENEFHANQARDHSSGVSERETKDPGIQLPDALFPELSFFDQLKLRETATRSNILQLYRKQACGKRERLPAAIRVVAQELEPEQSVDALTKIDEQLLKRNPVGVSIDNDILYALEVSQRGGHAVTLVGRRKIEGRCEYLVRNSLGPDCSGIPNCEAGNIWVPRQKILDSLKRFTWLE